MGRCNSGNNRLKMIKMLGEIIPDIFYWLYVRLILCKNKLSVFKIRGYFNEANTLI